jgi:hypothetical protein
MKSLPASESKANGKRSTEPQSPPAAKQQLTSKIPSMSGLIRAFKRTSGHTRSYRSSGAFLPRPRRPRAKDNRGDYDWVEDDKDVSEQINYSFPWTFKGGREHSGPGDGLSTLHQQPEQLWSSWRPMSPSSSESHNNSFFNNPQSFADMRMAIGSRSFKLSWRLLFLKGSTLPMPTVSNVEAEQVIRSPTPTPGCDSGATATAPQWSPLKGRTGERCHLSHSMSPTGEPSRRVRSRRLRSRLHASHPSRKWSA